MDLQQQPLTPSSAVNTPPAVITSIKDNTTADPASPSPLPSASPKLRLMCSYGGHIAPRPHDKVLCYVGGETRIVAVDRRTASSIPALAVQLSSTLLNGRAFVLKYQLPDDELDSLVSITTDEDLINMLDEYERLSRSSPPSRLRFFLFPVKSDSAGSGDSDLHDLKSEAWFYDCLRNTRVGIGARLPDTGKEGQGESDVRCGVGAGDPQSIVLETSSSFGSTDSAVSVSNLPAVRGGGGEEGSGLQLIDQKVNTPLIESFGSDSSAASANFQPLAIIYHDASDRGVVSKDNMVVSNISDTGSYASDLSAQTDVLKKPAQVVAYTVSQPIDQPQQQAAPPPVVTTSVPPQPQPQTQPQMQPQYVLQGSHYIPHYYTNAVPAHSYPTMYQSYVQQQPTARHYAASNPYPVYLMQAPPPQYDMSMQCNLAGVSSLAAPSMHAQLHTNPMMVTSSPLVYDGLSPAQLLSELAPKVYQPASVSTMTAPPQSVSVPSEEHQHPHQNAFVAYPPVPHVSQPLAAPTVENTNYGMEHEDPMHAQIYKTQPSAPALSSQFHQPITNAPTVMLSENIAQLQLDKTKQPVRN